MAIPGRARPRGGLRIARPLLLASALACAACGDASSLDRGARTTAPWRRTEQREACASFATLRQPFFGDLHVHTRYSADAYIFGTRVGPRGAYAFARGDDAVLLADQDEQQTRSARIDRPLDFAAVTDHAELFGEVWVCSTPGAAGYDAELCTVLRQAERPEEQFLSTVRWLFPLGIPNPPSGHGFCTEPGVDCDGAAVSVWLDIQAAAEEAYDRTAACSFTSFVGYEHTPAPLGRHLHRNVIFRNQHVPAVPKSQLETHGDGVPWGIWKAVEEDCLNAGEGCDAIIIPHNSNLSGGEQFLDPVDRADAQRRQDLEPLVEIHQQKGNSECRFDRLAGAGAGTEDELCTFEQIPVPHELPGTEVPPIEEYPRRNLVRSVLVQGLALEGGLGANPFRMGFVGSTDTHDATPGNTEEAGWEGGQGNNDATPALQISRELHTNPGGLAVVWAEENSRDAIFAALRRRESYATSGTRPLLRFFAGRYRGLDCNASDLLERAYREGTPMGGEIGVAAGGEGPDFLVWAAQDPGTAERPGTALQRIQIVKGWLDVHGQTHERVLDVAGNAHNGASVDPSSCEPTGTGFPELCAAWRDPDFDPAERAFYYARVLENPTCRWSTRVCQAAGVDPFASSCAELAAAAGTAFADCCRGEADDAFLSPLIQERAWSSPIWVRPEAIAELHGELRFGRARDDGRLALWLRIGHLPVELAEPAEPVVVVLHDDEEIARIEIPPAKLDRRAGGVSTTRANATAERDPVRVDGAAARRGAASLPGAGSQLELVRVDGQAGAPGGLELRVAGLDLARVQRSSHAIGVTLEAGAYRTEHARLWAWTGGRLRTDEP